MINAGTRLGPYEIVAALGAGGMGEVYRARDTRLERTVAVKVLPAHLSASAESRQRFEREAKTISQLSHPHICALYDVGHQDGVEFLVMEYLEGETLSDRLLKGALPFEQVLRYGIQIADALGKAHRQGIVHRDLKPANVMLTKSGVKLLDFGLAKATAPAGSPSDLTALPTVAGSSPLTQEGTILGTFQYMAPEQLEGKEADARTDIFAFGAVLYEMATGQKAFSGKSQASLIAAIFGLTPPAISTIQPMTPPSLDRVVKICLAKDPEDRWQSAHDVASELKWIAEGGSQVGIPAPVVARRKSRERLAWTIAAAALIAAGLAGFGYFRRAPSEAFRIRSFLLPLAKSGFELTPETCGSLTVSPDGRRVIFAAKGTDGKVALWVRSLDELAARPIPGTEGGRFPFWSPDGRFLAFFADRKLKKVDLAGSPPLELCEAPSGRSGAWNRDGVILFSPDSTSAIQRVPAAGGRSEPVTRLDEARLESTHRWATFLPDGRHFLYMAGSHAAGTKAEANAVYLSALGSNERTMVLRTRSNVVYASGYLLYIREHALLAQRFDAGRGRLTGEPVPLAENAQYDTGYFRGEFGASENGVLVYATGAASPNSRLYWHDRSGKRLGDPLGEPADYQRFSISPDGRRIAAEISNPSTGVDIWMIDPRGARTRFSFGSFSPSSVWSPDGSRLAYSRGEKPGGPPRVIVSKLSSGSGADEVLYRHPEGVVIVEDWSPDGRFLAFTVATNTTRKRDAWILSLAGDRKAHPFLATEFDEQANGFSPDGRWFLYTSDESGRGEIYVVPFPGPGGKWQVSTAGALGGSWLRGGREIFYLTSEINLVSLEVRTGASGLGIGSPKLLFSVVNWAFGATTADGERILGAELPGSEEKPRVALVTNWTAGLAKK